MNGGRAAAPPALAVFAPAARRVGEGVIHATRIQIICPCANAAQMRAANDVFTTLLADEDVRRWGGLTCSGVLEPAFLGAFWDAEVCGWEIERNALIFIDAVGEPEHACREYALALHGLVGRIYARHGQPQRRLWITVHPVAVIAGGRPNPPAGAP